MIERSRRSSSIISLYQDTVDYDQLERAFVNVYRKLKAKHKDQRGVQIGPTVFDFQQGEQLYRGLQNGIRMLRKFKQQLDVAAGRASQIDKKEQQHEIKRIRHQYDMEVKLIQAEAQSKILEMQTQNSLKQQQLTNQVSRLLQSITNAQKTLTKTQCDFQSQIENLLKALKMEVATNQELRQKHELLACLLQHGHNGGQNDDSMPSESLDYDGTEEDEDNQCYEQVGLLRDNINQLIGLGMFHQSNWQVFDTAFLVASQFKCPWQLLKSPIYPLLLDRLRLTALDLLDEQSNSIQNIIIQQ